jgi:hypothetical protein
MHPYQAIKQITQGNYQLSGSLPLTEVKSLIVLIYHYKPTKEERIFLKDRAIEHLKRWKDDLILGGAKK